MATLILGAPDCSFPVKQVVANVLSQRFPSTAIEAVQIAEPGELLVEHLGKALTPGTYEYEALGAESEERWDFVILQVCQRILPKINHSIWHTVCCTLPRESEQTPILHWLRPDEPRSMAAGFLESVARHCC